MAKKPKTDGTQNENESGSTPTENETGAAATAPAENEKKTARVTLSQATIDSRDAAIAKFGKLGMNELRANKLIRAEADRLCSTIDVVDLVRKDLDL